MIKLLSLFSGIGAFEKALDRQGIEYQLVNYCEIDKYASKSYSLIHNVSEQLNLGDITKINIDSLNDNIDFITHGSPCQDFSLAGKQEGGDEGSNTRSSLMWNTVDIVKHVKPKVVLWENVKNLLGKKHRHNFDAYIQVMDNLGYNSYYQVLNAKDFGIPQNRERVFTVSIRKDIDNGSFEFPEPFELKLRLKDMLEDEVDEKYYLSEDIQKRFKFTDDTFTKSIVGTTKPDFRTIGKRDLVYQGNGVMGALVATDYKQPKQILETKRLGGVFDTEKSKHQAGSVWDKEGLSPTLDTMQGGWRQPCIIDDNDIKLTGAYGRNFGSKGKLQDKDSICDTLLSAMGSGGGNVPIVKEQENTAQIMREEPLEREGLHRNAKEVLNTNGICRTLSTQSNNLATKIKEQKSLRIRKLTPRECFRLMGFDDSDFDKVEGNLSNTQLYKQAGNSIVVNVLEEIYKELFKSIKL